MGRNLGKEKRLAAKDKVWSLRIEGKSMHAIAKTTGLSSQTVYKMLHERAEEVSELLAGKVAEQKAITDAQIDHLLSQAMEAWQESKKPSVKERTISKRLKANGSVAGEPANLYLAGEMKIREVRYQCGDPRFLGQMLALLRMRAELWGLYAPKATADGVSVVIKTYSDQFDMLSEV